jgi:hypothetical protein
MFVPDDVVILALGALNRRVAPEARRITVNYRATTT